MGDTCEICKKNSAKISIGNHSYCFDCHNKMALHDMGMYNSSSMDLLESVKIWNLHNALGFPEILLKCLVVCGKRKSLE